ncbi:6-phosphogluconate dehydrogenase [Collybia nuda]|uniref:6-phosphogluconate dehydrogenase n=1 Tax=Collybia nuda TaxID=64659 RepID=A0A9P5YE26_9AGAR|nr:6-phosphogluconate dehydrogenase [Collybia nuda]
MANETEIKDILLVGFGAVGAIFSLILQRSGLARVTAVARSNFDAVNEHGLHFKSGKYGEVKGWKPYRLVRSVSEATDCPYSYVFVTTKAVPEVLSTSTMLKPLLSSPYADTYAQPTYFLLQNGLNVEVDLYQALKGLGKGEPRIVSTALWIGTNLVEANVVEHGHFDRVTLGMYRYNDFTTKVNTPDEAAIAEDVGGILRAGGSTITIVPDIHRMKYTKNFWNVAFSTYTTLSGYTVPAFFRQPPSDPSVSYSPYVAPITANLISEYTLPAIRSTLRELVLLARSIGYTDTEDGVPSSIVDRLIADVRELHITPESSHKPSMLLDVEKGQPIEVEVILGEVVRMARERGIEVPRIETLYALLLVVQNQILRKISENSDK